MPQKKPQGVARAHAPRRKQKKMTESAEAWKQKAIAEKKLRLEAEKKLRLEAEKREVKDPEIHELAAIRPLSSRSTGTLNASGEATRKAILKQVWESVASKVNATEKRFKFEGCSDRSGKASLSFTLKPDLIIRLTERVDLPPLAATIESFVELTVDSKHKELKYQLIDRVAAWARENKVCYGYIHVLGVDDSGWTRLDHLSFRAKAFFCGISCLPTLPALEMEASALRTTFPVERLRWGGA